MTTTKTARPLTWGHRVRKLTDRERLADPQRCAIDGCDEPGTHETLYYYRASKAGGRPWARRRRVCEVGADEFAARHRVPILEPARS